jgi:hypothetical protein
MAIIDVHITGGSLSEEAREALAQQMILPYVHVASDRIRSTVVVKLGGRPSVRGGEFTFEQRRELAITLNSILYTYFETAVLPADERYHVEFSYTPISEWESVEQQIADLKFARTARQYEMEHGSHDAASHAEMQRDIDAMDRRLRTLIRELARVSREE